MNCLAPICSRGGIGRRNGLKILTAISEKWRNIRFLRVSEVEVPELPEAINYLNVTFPSHPSPPVKLSAVRIAILLVRIRSHGAVSCCIILMRVVMNEDRLLTIEMVIERVSMGKTEIYKMVKMGIFPKPIKVKKKAVRWSNIEISAWIAEHLYNR